jgi:hypothetical protein
MLTIVLLSILTVVGLVAGWLIDKYTYADGLIIASYTIGIVSAMALITSLCLLINIDRRFDASVYRYETTVEMVESYTGQDYGNMGSLVEQVVSVNNKIAEHKAHYNSKWTGLWYSERIANLEPIKFSGGKNRPALE